MNPFRKWWNAASPAQKKRLARLARTTVGSLHQLAGSYRTKGKVRASPELARRIDIATNKMYMGIIVVPDPVSRGELSPVCHRCEYAKKCEGRK